MRPREQLLLHRFGDLRLSARLIDKDHPAIQPAAVQLKKRAEAVLRAPVFRMTDKAALAPSGNPRDYYSIGTYWWPNPDSKDGLPYVRRDGQINPESMDSDTGRVRQMCRQVLILALAWHFFRDERYARRCADQLRVWFLDPEQAMTPHLRHAQCIPGRSPGRSYGIIDTRGFRYLVDAATLLLDSQAWQAADQAALRVWMGNFLDWLLESPAGRKERRAPNNHGTWYNAQVLALALFCGDVRLSEQLASEAGERISQQIQPDGRQPEEYRRSRPLTYCTMNLWAFFELASLAENTTVDLWGYQAGRGASLKAAAAWLLPYLQRRTDWPEREIVNYQPENYLSLFRRAALRFDAAFESIMDDLDQDRVSRDVVQLQYPSAALREMSG